MKRWLRPGAALAPLGYAIFRAIWFANLFSSLGSLIQSVAAAWLMTELTTSRTLVALVQASATIPILLVGVPAGALADAHDRRVIMLWAQTGMLLVSGVLAVMGYAGMIAPASLLALTLLVGLGTAINAPAWQASVRLLVGAGDLPQAISLNAIAMNLARSLGPALGGVIISLWSVSLAFAINAISYLSMIVVLARWHPVTTPRIRQPMGTAIAAGLRFCLGSRPIRKVLLRGGIFGFGAAGFQALLPVAVRQMLGGDQLVYGLLLGSFGAGSVAGALWVSRARRRFGSENVVGVATVAFIVGATVLSLAHTAPPAAVAAFLAGGGWVATMTTLNVAMQLRSPDAILGRCLSIYQAVSFGSMALGAWTWGMVADLASPRQSLRATAVWMILALVLRFLAPMPKREEGRIFSSEKHHAGPDPDVRSA